MTGDQRILAAGAVGVLALAALLAWVFASDVSTPSAVAPEPTPKPGRKAPPPASAPAGPRGRVSLPRPAAKGHRTAVLDGNGKYALNASVDEVVRAARDACLAPWVPTLPAPHEVEFVLDVVTLDGSVTDFGFRAPAGEELPPDVVQCVADAVWGVDWPPFDGLSGETRLQRTFTVQP